MECGAAVSGPLRRPAVEHRPRPPRSGQASPVQRCLQGASWRLPPECCRRSRHQVRRERCPSPGRPAGRSLQVWWALAATHQAPLALWRQVPQAPRMTAAPARSDRLRNPSKRTLSSHSERHISCRAQAQRRMKLDRASNRSRRRDRRSAAGRCLIESARFLPRLLYRRGLPQAANGCPKDSGKSHRLATLRLSFEGRRWTLIEAETLVLYAPVRLRLCGTEQSVVVTFGTDVAIAERVGCGG